MTTMKSKVTGIVAVAAMATALAACSNSPSRTTACSLPQETDLGRAISATRFDLETGCEHQFDAYFQHLLIVITVSVPRPVRARRKSCGI